jgi:hypothetical protein
MLLFMVPTRHYDTGIGNNAFAKVQNIFENSKVFP